ncbi:MAG: hypothetical protein HKN70_05055 [Gammaproteobacteria bacterium]|nr:hypothetical protein [Gammaproteobacteria bacterium]
MAKTALVLVFVLILVSAYLRLLHSGIGCEDWPACYGRIGAVPATPAGPLSTDQEGVSDHALAPAAATLMHRLVATVLGMLVFIMTITAFGKKQNRLITVALLGLTLFLAILGLKSGSLHSPAVVMGNLVGGFSMLALLGWLVFARAKPAPRSTPTPIRGWTVAALVIVSAQILLGGFTSANFAAIACRSLPDCHGSWLPGPAISQAFNLKRAHQVNDFGVAIGAAERAAIHKTHRLGAILTVVAVFAAGIAALRAGPRFRGAAVGILVLVIAEFAVGVAAIVTQLPIVLAVAHNGLAALMLLGLIKLQTLNRPVSPA